MLTMGRCVAFAAVAVLGTLAQKPDLFANPSGLWSLQAVADTERWVEIHNLDEAKASGLFHIEVLGRRRRDPVWRIQHLAPHLAITRAALERSVGKPLKTGAVYPESFDSAYQVWLADERAGKHPLVCDSSVDECLKR